ncbi:MAG: radical SAM protein [Deltaproteobacteria bacterium]|nr:radical SAM protein [Deltaproteobacteria bacterium]
MRVQLIYPKWPRREHLGQFNLPPHGPVCFAAALPDEIEISFVDENVEEIDFDTDAELVALSVMLTCQVPRACELADRFRAMNKVVIAGGIAVALHSEEMAAHTDAVFLGEAEGSIGQVLEDLKRGQLRERYDYLDQPPDTGLIGTARRSVLNRELYNFRGVQMVDLVHASRGCRFNCFPCCVGFLGGRTFRPRPIEAVVAELESIDNNRLFFVDNSFAQDGEWEKNLFSAIAPLKKKWISHPIKDDEDVLDLARDAGCWYVYQAIAGISESMGKRIRRLKERGIGVEGTVILGTDEQDEEYIKRLVDFLLELEIDAAEFTVLTPFPHSPIRAHLEAQNRILHNDWERYTSGEVVFQPARMSASTLQEMYEYAWEKFHAACGEQIRMAKLYLNVIEKEKADGTYQKVELTRERPDRSAQGMKRQR